MDLIITVVNRGARGRGNGRSQGERSERRYHNLRQGTAGEVEKFFGISFQSEKEVVLIVVEHGFEARHNGGNLCRRQALRPPGRA